MSSPSIAFQPTPEEMKKVERRVRNAAIELVARMPELDTLLARMLSRLKLDDSVGTAGVTAGLDLFVSPTYVATLRDNELIGLIAHECFHPLLEHFSRARDRVPAIFNVASDAELNRILRQLGVTLPDGAIFPETVEKELGLPAGALDGKIAEEIYDLLPKPTDRDRRRGGGQGHGRIKPLDDHSVWGEAEGAEQVEAKRIVQKTKNALAGSGTIPRDLKDLLGRFAPKVRWEDLLRAYMGRYVGSQKRRTWKRPHRKLGPAAAAKERRGARVGLVVDSSGSVSDKEMAVFLAEVQKIAQHAECFGVYCAEVATEVMPLSELIGREDVPSGGTDLRVGIAKVLKENPDVVVVLTDGGTQWPTSVPKPMIVATTLVDGPDYATNVKVEVEE